MIISCSYTNLVCGHNASGFSGLISLQRHYTQTVSTAKESEDSHEILTDKTSSDSNIPCNFSPSAALDAGIAGHIVESVPLPSHRDDAHILSRCLINAGDSTQRFLLENKIKISAIRIIIVTSLSPSHISGIPGLIHALSTLVSQDQTATINAISHNIDQSFEYRVLQN